MGNGVRVLAGLLAAGLLSSPAHARVEPAEVIGSYPLQSAGCEGVIDDNQFQIVDASENSLRFIAGGETLNADTFDASSGHFAMASGDGYLTVNGVLTREPNAVALDLDVASPPLGLNCHVVASKPADPAAIAEEATTDAALAAGAAVEVPPESETTEPSDSEVAEALRGLDENSILIIGFLAFLLLAAAATYRREHTKEGRRRECRSITYDVNETQMYLSQFEKNLEEQQKFESRRRQLTEWRDSIARDPKAFAVISKNPNFQSEGFTDKDTFDDHLFEALDPRGAAIVKLEGEIERFTSMIERLDYPVSRGRAAKAELEALNQRCTELQCASVLKEAEQEESRARVDKMFADFSAKQEAEAKARYEKAMKEAFDKRMMEEAIERYNRGRAAKPGDPTPT